MRLSKLQWAAVALSDVLIVGPLIYSYNPDLEVENNFAEFSYRLCAQERALSRLGERPALGTNALQNRFEIPFADAGGAPEVRLAEAKAYSQDLSAAAKLISQEFEKAAISTR